MRDPGKRCRRERLGRRERAIILQIGLPGEGADCEPVGRPTPVVERRDPVEVDDDVRGDQPHVEHGSEALPAGKEPRVVAVLGEEIKDLLDRAGIPVGERRGFHAGSGRRARSGAREEPIARARSQTRSGVSGN